MGVEVKSYAMYLREIPDLELQVLQAALDHGWVIRNPDGWLWRNKWDRSEDRPSVEEVDASREEIFDLFRTLERPSITIHPASDATSVFVSLSSSKENVAGQPISVPAALEFYTDRARFAKSNPPETLEANVDAYLDLMELVTRETDPAFIFGGPGGEIPAERLPSLEQLETGRIPWVFPLNVFSRPAIDRIGRERLLSAPAYEVREIGDDHILIMAPNTLIAPSDEWRDAAMEVMAHLSELESETVRRRNKEFEWYETERVDWLIPPEDEES